MRAEGEWRLKRKKYRKKKKREKETTERREMLSEGNVIWLMYSNQNKTKKYTHIKGLYIVPKFL